MLWKDVETFKCKLNIKISNEYNMFRLMKSLRLIKKRSRRCLMTHKQSQKYICRENRTLKELQKDVKTIYCKLERRFVRY